MTQQLNIITTSPLSKKIFSVHFQEQTSVVGPVTIPLDLAGTFTELESDPSSGEIEFSVNGSPYSLFTFSISFQENDTVYMRREFSTSYGLVVLSTTV